MAGLHYQDLSKQYSKLFSQSKRASTEPRRLSDGQRKQKARHHQLRDLFVSTILHYEHTETMSPHSGRAGAPGKVQIRRPSGWNPVPDRSSEEHDLPKYSTQVGQRRQMRTVGCVKNGAIEHEI